MALKKLIQDVLDTWERGQRALSREDFIEGTDELAGQFQMMADAAREDAEAEGEI